MHRTYYELGKSDWERINREGYLKGVTVWFVDPDCYQHKFVKKGVIIGHSIHIEGDIQLEVEYTEKTEWELNERIWVSDEKHRRGVDIDKYTKTVFMDWAFFTKKEAYRCAKQIMKTRISRAQSELKYKKKLLKELENKYGTKKEEKENIPSPPEGEET